jgi:hypothetical protein
VAVCLLVAATAMGQETAKDSPASPPAQKPAATKTQKKPALAEVTRVSTTDAAQSVAKDKAKEKAQEPGREDSTQKPADSSVTEFRPASPDAASSGETTAAPSKDSKKSALDRVHGTVYGSADPGNKGTHRTGAAAGISSKSGKTSIYVETERARETPPPR